MFKTIAKSFQQDKDLPERAYRIDTLTRVLDGALYDNLPYDFHTEREPGTDAYVPLRSRRPSVRYALCRTVVDDSVSMLFGDNHFPSLNCEDETTREALESVMADCMLNEVMIDAATRGSVGSVAVVLRVLEGRLFFEAMSTGRLTPVWKPSAPDTLLKVVERYKVQGKDLRSAGYTTIKDDEVNSWFWFQREFTATHEIWYLPKLVGEKGSMIVDALSTVEHKLQFVPIVWVRNLPGGDKVDGRSTFPDEAVDCQIELDYLLSQAGRGLKYASDPTLLIKEPAMDNNGQLVKGGGNAIVVSAEGDAKMLEINGTAATAVIEYVRAVRELALESAHGNRTSPDKLSAAQSGRAMELLNQALVWLSSRLRISYGERGLLQLLRMVVKVRALMPLTMADGRKVPDLASDKPLSLRWPQWYSATYTDKQAEADTLTTLREGGLLSQETAVNVVADAYDIRDPADELKKIKAEPPPPTAPKPKPSPAGDV